MLTKLNGSKPYIATAILFTVLGGGGTYLAKPSAITDAKQIHQNESQITALRERIATAEAFQITIKEDIREIKTNVDLLVQRTN